MDNWRKSAYRITKYNPCSRDENGFYIVDEWISISDIGKEFNGIKFTFQDYIQMENKYILSINEFCNYFGIEEFEIKNLGFFDPEKMEQYSSELKETYEGLEARKSISKVELEKLARLILRGFVWCDLENEEKGIHFGYDYYMYFDMGIGMPEELKEKIERIGLYAEE